MERYGEPFAAVKKNNTHDYFGIDTLEFLQKKRRIGKATAFAGNLLNIMRCCLLMKWERSLPVEKVSGKRKRLNRLKENSTEHIWRTQKYRLYFVDGGMSRDTLKKEIIDVLGAKSADISELGCALAQYLGKNLVGVVFRL